MCPSMLSAPKVDTSAQKAEARRQAAAEQDRISKDKRKRLDERRSGPKGEGLQSLVSFSAQSTGGRSFFSPTGG